MNTHAKGNRIEREFMQVLKNSKNFEEIWKPCHCRGNSDIFGLFDIITINSEFGDWKTSFFQVKSNKSDYSKFKKKIKKFVERTYTDCYIALRVKKGLWKIDNIYYSNARFKVVSLEYYVNDKFEEVEK